MDKVPISRFKTNCTAIVDQVVATGQPVTITRHGKAVAEVVPARLAVAGRRVLGGMQGKPTVTDDLIDTTDLWDFDESTREWDELNSAIAKDTASGAYKRRKKS